MVQEQRAKCSFSTIPTAEALRRNVLLLFIGTIHVCTYMNVCTFVNIQTCLHESQDKIIVNSFIILATPGNPNIAAHMGVYPSAAAGPVNAPNAFSQQLLAQLANQQLLLSQPTTLSNSSPRGPVAAGLYGPSPIFYYYPSPPMYPQSFFNNSGTSGL